MENEDTDYFSQFNEYKAQGWEELRSKLKFVNLEIAIPQRYFKLLGRVSEKWNYIRFRLNGKLRNWGRDVPITVTSFVIILNSFESPEFQTTSENP